MISPHPSAAEMETTAEMRAAFKRDAEYRNAHKIGAGSVGVTPDWALAFLRDFARLESSRSTAIAEGRKAMRDEIVAWLRIQALRGFTDANRFIDAIESGEPQQGGAA